jgi:hypothetical protein
MYMVEVTVICFRFEILTIANMKISAFWNVIASNDVSEETTVSILWEQKGFSKILLLPLQPTWHCIKGEKSVVELLANQIHVLPLPIQGVSKRALQ